MKICYVLNSGSPGGVEQHVLDLTRGMVARGHEVYVVCPWGEMAQKYFDAGAKVRVDSPKLDIDPFYIIRLVKFLKKTKLDVFHVHMLKTVGNGLLAVKLLKLVAAFPNLKGSRTFKVSPAAFSVKTIVHIHTPLPEWQIPWWKKKIDIFFNRIVSNWAADVVIALTESRKRVKVEGEGIDPEKIVVIPNGVAIGNIKSQSASRRTNNKLEYRRKLGVGEDTVLVGTLSRLTVEKGVRYLIEAIALLESKELPITNFQFSIGGSGELQDDLKEKARDLGLAIADETGDSPKPGFAKTSFHSGLDPESNGSSCQILNQVQDDVSNAAFSAPVSIPQVSPAASSPKIKFLGFVPEEEKWDYLNALDIFVFPSLAEGFGISLIEAMAADTACLASDLEVLQEVGGDAVQYFEAKNPEDLAENLAELIKDEERRKQLAPRAQKRVEQEYSLEKFWNRYESLYQELIER